MVGAFSFLKIKYMDSKSVIGGQYGYKGKEVWYIDDVKNVEWIIAKKEEEKHVLYVDK